MASSTLRGWSRSTAKIGTFGPASCALAWVNTGLSMIFSRINMPTPSSSTPSKNGTRQPQERKAASFMEDTIMKTAFASSSPTGTPACTQLA